MSTVRNRLARKVIPDEKIGMPTWEICRLAMERKYWTELYIRCNGNMTQVARIAKTHRGQAYKVMRRMGIGPWLKNVNPNWDRPLEPFSDKPTKGKPRMHNPNNPRRKKK